MEMELLVCSFSHGNGVTMKIHHSVGSCVVHLAIVEELIVLEHTVPLLPGPDVVSLLEECSVALWLSNAERTQTDIVGRPREVHTLLQC